MLLAQIENEQLPQLLNPENFVLENYTPLEVFGNTALALLLGLAVAYIYKATHKGLAYEQSMPQTFVFATMIVAITLMVIGPNPVSAFALMGTVSIIRFRTGLADPRDTSFLFACLALGIAAGTSSYKLAALGFGCFALLTLYIWATNFGSLETKQLLVRFDFDLQADRAAYQTLLSTSAQRATLLNEDTEPDSGKLALTYDIQLGEEGQAKGFLSGLKRAVGVSKVTLIQSRREGGL